MKSQLIFNPVAGSDPALPSIEIIKDHLRSAFGEINVFLTEKAGDARKFAANAVSDGCSHIFIGGGDGTLNEVLNGVAATKNGLEQITFGLIPLGTGNDFANAALSLSETIKDTLNILTQNKTILVDVGKLTNEPNVQYFINVSAGGFIAEVSDVVNPELKSIAGKLAYVIGGAQVLLDFAPVRTLMKLRYASGELIKREFEIEMFAVCNSKMLGGGRMIAPDAKIDDGLFDICVFTATATTLEFINVLTQIAAGAHLGEETVKYYCAPAVEFEFEREIKVNADGEVLTVKKVTYEILPSAARFLAG
ncbi:MAG: diacylglycerol kinase family protein [Pyrinomonadaceae bacterium]